MFAKLSLFLLAAASLVTSIQIAAPTNAHSASPVTIRWTNEGNDFQNRGSFSIFLINQRFNNFFGLANNVPQTSSAGGEITILLPVVLDSEGYTIQFTNNGNRSDIFGTSPVFSINTTPLSQSTSASVSSRPVTSGVLSASSLPPVPVPSSSPVFGTTLSQSAASSATPSALSPAGVSSSAPSSSATGAAFNAAQSLTGDVGGKALVAVVAAALAGMVAVVA